MHTADRFDVVVIGNIINETIVINGELNGPVLGSPAAYSSVALVKLGMNAGLASYYGTDIENGLIKNLCGVDISGLIRTNRTSTNRLIYKTDGTKEIVFEHKAPNIKKKDLLQAYVEHCEVFYICPMDYEVDIGVIKMLREKRKTIAVDLGGYGGATSTVHPSISDPAQFLLLASICESSQVVKASIEDMSLIMPHKGADKISDFFIGLGAENCVITLGGEGSFYKTAQGTASYVPAFQSDKPFNFTGAGDVFGAGLIADYIRNRDIHSAVRYGNAVASLVIEKEGGCVSERMPAHPFVINRMKGSLPYEYR